MRYRKCTWFITALLLCGFLLSLGCPNAGTTGSIAFDNQTGQRLRIYIDGIFMNFFEVSQTQTIPKNPIGVHTISADNFSDGQWGPIEIFLLPGTTYTWVIQ